MTKQSQVETVRTKLLNEGVVTNFWAIKNYILRLGAIIFILRQEGIEIQGHFGMGKDKKNYHYELVGFKK